MNLNKFKRELSKEGMSDLDIRFGINCFGDPFAQKGKGCEDCNTVEKCSSDSLKKSVSKYYFDTLEKIEKDPDYIIKKRMKVLEKLGYFIKRDLK